MTEIVQALATLEADPTQADAGTGGSPEQDGCARKHRDPVGGQDRRCRRSSVIASAAMPSSGSFYATPCLDSGLRTPRGAGRTLCDKGRVYADDLLRDKEAGGAFNAALKLQDDHEAAQDALSQLEMVAGNWPKIVKKFVDEAKVSTDRQLTTGLYTNIGEIYAANSPATNDAETHWYMLAVELRNRRASQHLERHFRAARRFPRSHQGL